MAVRAGENHMVSDSEDRTFQGVWMMKIRRLMNAALLVMSAGMVGCGSSPDFLAGRVPVSGTITLNDEPLADAEVYFISGTQSGFARTNEAGQYVLQEGAVPGDHRVLISKKSGGSLESLVPGYGSPGLDAGQLQAATAGALNDPMKARQLKSVLPKETLPPDYSSPEKSILNFTVPDSGASEADFRLLANR